ncbi:MAG: helix-turn-helix domain-containing protein, partial [Planctomycetes bacterium]|nr:helix-turn-helix domain-containing protein [Planctomycetota bacterium]
MATLACPGPGNANWDFTRKPFPGATPPSVYRQPRALATRQWHQEITRARIERITRLLLETNRSVTQIAFDLGFNGPDRVSRYFQRHQGIPPSSRSRLGAHTRLTFAASFVLLLHSVLQQNNLLFVLFVS